MNPEYTQYAPSDITTVDMTNEDNPTPLSEFFLDADIRDIVEESINPADVNGTFATNFPELARKTWVGPNVSTWATGLWFPVAQEDQE